MPKFGILTCMGSTLTVPLLEAMSKLGVYPEAIFVDGSISSQNRSIDLERLLPDYQIRDLPDFHPDSPVYFVEDHNSNASIGLYSRMGVDYLVNAGTPRILKRPLLDSVKGVVNCHPGILPKYRGCMCLEWSIFNDDPVGATAHLMSEKIDEGPILLTETMEVAPKEDYRTVRTRMISHQAITLSRALRWIKNNPDEVKKLPPQGAGKYHKPMPKELFAEVQEKLSSGRYTSS